MGPAPAPESLGLRGGGCAIATVATASAATSDAMRGVWSEVFILLKAKGAKQRVINVCRRAEPVVLAETADRASRAGSSVAVHAAGVIATLF